MINDILKFKKLNKLKSVYRLNSVDTRKESSAEHTWSALMLADYLIEKYSITVDKLRVFEILLYHDVVEIQTGDIALHPDVTRDEKSTLEAEGVKVLASQLPSPVNTRLLSFFADYEARDTREAKFAKAISDLDAEIHELDYKEDWAGYTESFIRTKKEKYMQEFPELKEVFEQVMTYLCENDYFDKE